MKASGALHCISIGFSRKGIQTRMPFLIIFAMQFFQLYVVFFLKRALNRVRFLFAYKSNKPHHKKYFHFF